jgi:VanZ family protein
MKWSWALTAILLVAAYASLDEFHQLFVPGRTAAVTDVLLDTAGGAAAQLAAAFFLSRTKAHERQTS